MKKNDSNVEDTRKEVSAAGCVGYITKPIAVKRLFDTIIKLLG